MSDTRFPHVPGHSPVSAKLIEILRDSKADQLTDEALTAACGKDTRSGGKGYASLGVAIRYVAKHHGIVWERIPKAWAIRKLDSSQIVESTGRGMRRMGRIGKREVIKLGAVEVQALPIAERSRYNAHAAQLSTLVVLASRDATKKLETRNESSGLDLKRLLDAMKNGEKKE